jgi:hypothetical protein
LHSYNGSAEACVSFAEKYGLLCERAVLSEPPSEDLKLWRTEIRNMLANVRMLPRVIRVANTIGKGADGKPTITPRGTYAKVRKIDVLLVPGEGIDALPVMVMEPVLDATKLEMAHFIGGGGRLIPCKNCGLFFQAGRSGGKRAIPQR